MQINKMNLFKGSKIYMNPFPPQPVHPDDFHKFPEPIPSSVIFASESEIKAKIFATFSGIISFGTSSTSQKPGITIHLSDSIEPEVLKEKVYIYRFDSETEGWKFIEKSGEWYNITEQAPLEVREYTREELYKELKENPEITFEEELKEKENTAIS